jgi:hypothetical protein
MIPHLIPYVRGLSLVAALSAAAMTNLSAQVFVGSDNFDSGSATNWNFFYRLSGSNGVLNFTNQRLDFTTAAGTGSYFMYWRGNGSVGAAQTSTSYTNSWVADLTVADTFVPAGSGFASIGLQVEGAGTGYAAVMLQNVAGAYLVRAEGTAPFTFASNSATGFNTNVGLRLAWDAGSHVLSSYYSFDSGATYSPLQSFTPDTQWSVIPTAGFVFEIFGNTNSTTAITTGMYADNFSVSAVPEPSTYAALAGACALGLAIWKRKRKAPAL